MSKLRNFFEASTAAETESRVHHPLSIAGNYLTGNYRNNPKVHNLVPAFFVFQIGAIALTAFAARTSYSRYFDITKDETIAAIGTSAVAIIIYFASSYFAGIAAEFFNSKETKVKRSISVNAFLKVAAIISFIVALVFGSWDFKMNIAGAADLGNSFVESDKKVDFQAINSAHEESLKAVQNTISELKAGKLGFKFGWFTSGEIGKGAFALNKKGVSYLADLEAKESKYLDLKIAESSTKAAGVDKANEALQARRNFAQDTFKAVAKFVYVVQFLACLAAAVFSQLIAYFIDTKQADFHDSKEAESLRSDFAKSSTDKKEKKTKAGQVQNSGIKTVEKVIFQRPLFTAQDAKKGRRAQLTAKQKKVNRAARLRASGHSFKEIAKRMKLTERTIQGYFSTSTKTG